LASIELNERRLERWGRALDNPERPFVAIIGGAQLSDKLPLFDLLISRHADKILVGGAVAYNFLKAAGFTVGKSIVENVMLDAAREIKRRAESEGVKLVLPTDHQVVDSFDPLHSRKTIPIEFTNIGHVGLDIGAETVALFTAEIKGAKAIAWHGPMGVFEEKGFEEGTLGVARAVVGEHGAALTITGDATLEFLVNADLPDNIQTLARRINGECHAELPER
jgi:3-phosphoglycerate kinase